MVKTKLAKRLELLRAEKTKVIKGKHASPAVMMATIAKIDREIASIEKKINGVVA
jgi:hypothetical protein